MDGLPARKDRADLSLRRACQCVARELPPAERRPPEVSHDDAPGGTRVQRRDLESVLPWLKSRADGPQKAEPVMEPVIQTLDLALAASRR